MNSTSAVQKRGIYWQSLVRWAIAFLVAGLAAWLSARHIQWAELGAALAHPHWLLLAAALATVLATTAGKAARWLVLLRHSGTRASPARVVRVLLIGQMGNSFLPARIGDVARAVLLGPQSAAGVPAVLGTVVVEKALDGLVGLLMLAGLALGTPLPAWLRQSIFGFTLLTGLLLALLILAAVRREWAARTVRSLFRFLPAGLRARAESLLVRFGQGLGLLRSPGDALLALAWTAIVWGLAASTNVVALAALDIATPLWSTWLVLAAVYVANFLPTVPGQVGLFEYSCILALAAVGVGWEPALAFGIVLHLLVYGPPAILGAASMVAEGLSWSKLSRTRVEPLEEDGPPV